MTESSHSALQEMEAAMLRACVASCTSDNPSVRAATEHLALPGNQLRARCCLDAAGRLDLPLETGISLAAVCELLHNASLLHDDLIDRAPERRGQPSIWSRYGDGVAICTGDLMLGAAYDLAADACPGTASRDLQKLVHRRTRDVILGEAAELAAWSQAELTIANYEALACGKSAPLLSLSLELPLLASGYRAALPLVTSFAACFAIAYQIVDDLADSVQDSQTHSLNVVAVRMGRHGSSIEEARAYAVDRAITLLGESFAIAANLPYNCAHTMVEHAERMLHQLEAMRSRTSLSLQG